MRVCVFGAGAIGGHLAARLIANTNARVSIVARGAHLDAIRQNGVLLRSAGQDIGGRPVAATDDAASLPAQDLVFVTLKAPAQPAAASAIAGLLGDGAAVVFAMNGVPWWWLYGTGRDAPLDLLDPEGALWSDVRPERALGAVVNSSNEVVGPGVIAHTARKQWRVGEPTGADSVRARDVVDLLARAGLDASLSTDIRADIWRKLCVNVSASPIAALTRLVSMEAAATPGLDDIAIRSIRETLAVAAAMGHDLRAIVSPDAIVSPRAGRAAGRPSMLQDALAGRAMEVEAIVGQVQGFGREAGVPTPTIDVILPLLRGLDRALRLARERRD